MAWTVTATEVKDLTGSSLADAVVDSFITASAQIVTDRLADGSGFTDAKLKQIHLFLSAHLVTVNRERQALEEKVDPASIKYSDIFGSGLQSTTYGQTALSLDTSGLLQQAYMKRPKIQAAEEKHEFKYPIRDRI